MEAPAPARPSSATITRSEIARKYGIRPHPTLIPPTPAPTFHAGDRRFESGWGYWGFPEFCGRFVPVAIPRFLSWTHGTREFVVHTLPAVARGITAFGGLGASRQGAQSTA
jgi:hypothetical protein